jgi:hypothetical protein
LGVMGAEGEARLAGADRGAHSRCFAKECARI